MTNPTPLAMGETSALLPGPASAKRSDTTPDPYTRTTSRAGYAYILLSTVGFAVMLLLLHVAETTLGLSTPRALLLRTGVQTVFSGGGLLLLTLRRALTPGPPGAPHSPHPLALPPGALRWLALRGVLGACGLLLHTTALKLLPVGDATAIFFTMPVFTMLFAYLLVGERVTRTDAAAGALSLVGGVLVGTPGLGAGRIGVSAMDRAVGSLMVLGAAVLSGVTYTTVRKLGSSINFLCSVLALGVCGLTLALALGGGFDVVGTLAGTPTDAEGERFRLAVATGVASAIGGFVGQCGLSRALQLSKAGPAMLLRNLDVPIVYAVSITMLGEAPSVMRAAGAALIVGSALVIAVQKVK